MTSYDFNYKDQVKLLSVQVQDYRERLFREETLKQKVFIELEKLENEYGKLEKERDTFKKMLIEKDREIQCIKKDYNQLQGRVSMGQVTTVQNYQTNPQIKIEKIQSKRFSTVNQYQSPQKTETRASNQSQGVFDTMMNDSILSDLRNELYTAKKLQGYEKEELLFEIQDKLNQLITDTKPQFEYMNKFQEVVLENQQLHIELNSQDQYIKDINSQLNQYQIKNEKLEDDYRVSKQMNKELKKEKRNFENQALKEQIKSQQLQDILKLLTQQAASNGNQETLETQQLDTDANRYSFEEQAWIEEIQRKNQNSQLLRDSAFLQNSQLVFNNAEHTNPVNLQQQQEQPQQKQTFTIIGNNCANKYTSNNNQQNLNLSKYDQMLQQVIMKLDSLQEQQQIRQAQDDQENYESVKLPKSRKNLKEIFSSQSETNISPNRIIQLKPTETTETSINLYQNPQANNNEIQKLGLQKKHSESTSPFNFDLSVIKPDDLAQESLFKIELSHFQEVDSQKNKFKKNDLKRQKTIEFKNFQGKKKIDFFENFYNVQPPKQIQKQRQRFSSGEGQIEMIFATQNQSQKFDQIADKNRGESPLLKLQKLQSLQPGVQISSKSSSNQILQNIHAKSIEQSSNSGSNGITKSRVDLVTPRSINGQQQQHQKISQNLIMRESIIGNFLIDKAQSINEQKRKDSSLSQILDDRDQISNSRQKEEDFLFKSYQPQTLNQDQNFMRASNDIQNNTHFKPERRVSFKKESQTPALNSVKMMPQMFMGTPTLLNAYFQKKQRDQMFYTSIEEQKQSARIDKK
eukprot:403355396